MDEPCGNDGYLLDHVDEALMNDIRFRFTSFQYESQLSQKQQRVERYSRLIKNLKAFDRMSQTEHSAEDLILIELTFLDSVKSLAGIDSIDYQLSKFNELLTDIKFPIKPNVKTKDGIICIKNEQIKAKLIVRYLSDHM